MKFKRELDDCTGTRANADDNGGFVSHPKRPNPTSSEPLIPKRSRKEAEIRWDCPYLDTINRRVLDFDFEKFCSVSLSNSNVYACLVCGKYYRGRGKNSQAYTHSLEEGHHVYMNLQSEKFYCLPDGYEIIDASLDDIRLVLNPRFSEEQIEELDGEVRCSRGLDGSDYLPGTVSLFNILRKFDGDTVTEVVYPQIAKKRYRITKLPQYMILHMPRFAKNNFFVEKNPTLVNFPMKSLELKDQAQSCSRYFVHSGQPGEGSYKVFVQRKLEKKNGTRRRICAFQEPMLKLLRSPRLTCKYTSASASNVAMKRGNSIDHQPV